MALRLLEIIVPEQYFNEVSGVLEKNDITDYWQTCSCESKIIFKIILQAEKSEALMDQFERKYRHLQDFRLILLPLEASCPTHREMEQKERDLAGEGEPEKVPLRVSRQEIYNEIFDNSKLTRIFLVMVLLSTVVAAVGLLRNNVAVVIGAMVIAPLLGPNVALSLAVTLGDDELGRNASKTNLAGVVLAFVVSLSIGYFAYVDPNQPEIFSRTIVSYADIILALASGVAGALAFTTGAPAALIGVMVAVALIPPLVTSGMLFGSGFVYKAVDAFLLFLINMICINLAGVVTFLVQGIRPINWWEANKAKKSTRTAVLIWSGLLIALILLLYVKYRV
ncbi:MAG: TIGR00341 family protein [Desulfobulbaceae bacterium]|nr:TIGR00341 family protein [Desulfobulbaceae bacterium]